MKKIALIYMGGTFGCYGDPLRPMQAEDFIPKLAKVLPIHLQIDCFAATRIRDSSSATAQDWLLLIQQIQTLQLQQYQHFVIIHGTDTLTYAASTLARFLQQSCHVMITGSQYPLLNVQGDDNRDFTDAVDNLNTALDHLDKVQNGVYIAFNHQVFHACTTAKIHSTDLHAFHGLTVDQAFTLAEQSQMIIQDEHIEKAKKLNIINWMMQPIEIELLNTNLETLKHHLPDVLILQGYGTGNIAVNDQTIELLLNIQQLGCHVILDTQVTFGGIDQRYAISQWIKQAKILINDTHSRSDLYAKILKMYLQYPTSDQWHDRWYSQ
ncbi:asparaginase [Acinetobacter sp. 194]|uniref:asparaginase domain-containing protein n=1 Tax=Acinetobacter shaoyimingii TaxID=2715164 RepID=UPI00140B62F4|nr:asparaginase domain-containing protein [Acinetobacter shaoyimingii]NHB56587.1 asparaginase [Acinetobacter shaoyimingii]